MDKEKVLELVIPFILPRLSEKEQQIFQQLRKCYSKQEHRALIISRAWARLISSASIETGKQALYDLRMLKTHFDVFKSITVVCFQEEVQTAMWLVRIHCTEFEWAANGEMGLKPYSGSTWTALCSCSCKPAPKYSSRVGHKWPLCSKRQEYGIQAENWNNIIRLWPIPALQPSWKIAKPSRSQYLPGDSVTFRDTTTPVSEFGF